MKRGYKNVETLGVSRFDEVEKMLEKTLDEYESDRKRGEGMISEMVGAVQEKMEQLIL
jgi:hypothetical protein